MAKINFDEQTHFAFYSDFRAFVFGVDISEYIVEGTLDWTHADRDGFSTASFSIQNANDNFVVTKENLGTDIDPKTQLPSGRPRFRLPTNVMYSEAAKQSLMASKQAAQGNKTLYPLSEKNLVINKNDPIRIFIQNPISLNEWYFAFTGYIDEVSKDIDYITGQSNIKISCTDLRKMMERMRVQKNPVPVDHEVVVLADPKSFFADLIVPTTFNHPFAKMSFEDSMAALLLGQSNASSATGVGLIAKGDVYFYNSENPKAAQIVQYTSSNVSPFASRAGVKASTKTLSNQDMLHDWYDLCFFGRRPTGEIRALTYAEVIDIGTNSLPNGKYAPDHVKFHMILPAGGTKSSSLVKTEYAEYVEQRDWDNRYNIIRSFSETIDYQFWVTPCGDVVFEFPMYELLPEDFDYENILTVDDFLISDDISDETGDICTVLSVTGSILSNVANTDLHDAVNASNIPKVLITNSNLAMRFGIKIEEHQLPSVVNKVSLGLLAHVEFFKRLSRCSKMSMKFSYRPWLLPNKPVYNPEEERMGLTYSVTNRLNLFSDCATDVVLNYIRKKNANGDFLFMDGSKSVVASYTQAWQSQNGNGVQVGTELLDIATPGVKQ
jgi:hypothetical protein